MANRPFTRLNSSDAAYVSASPSHDFDHHPDPYRVPSNDGTPMFGQGHNNYATHAQTHNIAGFMSMPQQWGTSYNPVMQSPEGEKVVPKSRRATQSSGYSRRTSGASSKFLSPLLTKSWHHDRDHNSMTTTVRNFSKKKQSRRIFLHGMMQLVPTILFSVCMLIVFYVYAQRKEYVTRGEKYVFNTLILGSTLLLGFSVQSGFKLYADLMRWRFLSMRYWSVKTFEQIMGCSSQRTVLKLLWSARKRSFCVPSRVQVVCFIYFLVFIGLQAVIACIGLCYAVENNDNVFGRGWGNVTVVNLTNIQIYQYPIDKVLEEKEGYALQGGAANSYGISGTPFLTYTDSPPAEYETGPALYYSTAKQMYWYQFLDCDAGSGGSCNVSVSSTRQVWSNATCVELPIIRGGYPDASNVTYEVNGVENWFNFGDNLSTGTTMYAANMNDTCGARCTELMVLNTGFSPNSTTANPPQLFGCTNTIDQVINVPSNVDQTAYTLPDLQARIFAGAIGYSGQWSYNSDWQSKNYPSYSGWGWDYQTMTPELMAQRIMRFSVGAICAMDENGGRVLTQGSYPFRVQTVNMKWMWTIIVLLLPPVVQFLFLFFVIWFCRGVMVRDGSPLGNAKLLRPIAEKLGARGCALSGEDIAEMLSDIKIAYGVTSGHHNANNNTPSLHQSELGYESADSGYFNAVPGQSGTNGMVMHLDVIVENSAATRKPGIIWNPGNHMPSGNYDGLHLD